MLHLIQKSPFQTSCLSECLNIAKPEDQFILMQDGVYAIQKSDFTNDFKNIFVLSDDLTARGLELNNQSASNIKAINYEQFVALTLNTDKTMSWF